MPFIRYTRDKRGYESTYVMHAYRPGQGPQRARVLYLFRTPAHVTIGRKALEPEVMEALERTHPDLSFDWTNLPAERPAEPAEARDNRARRQHHQPSRPAGPQSVAPVAPVLEDESPLGRVVGAERAARLRSRYLEISQRIGRRSRTPEERDRLLERMQRLNPEEWIDEAAVRAVVFTVEAEWEGIAAELPSRRRGRRGGRYRQEPNGPSSGSSGIIEETGPLDQQDGGHDEADLSLDPDDSVSDRGGGRGLGPDAEARSASSSHEPVDEPTDPDAAGFSGKH